MPISLGTTTITALFLGTTSIVSAYLGSTQVFGGSFSPLSLFSGGAQGVWYDPSDLSTMFVDRAGTIQVTTPGTVVGKRLDKSGRGNHATAPTDAARPVYGIEPKGGRRNLLTWTEDFGNAVWTKNNLLAFGSGSTVNATVAPDGTTTADLITPATGTALTGVDQYYNNTASAAHTLSVSVKANGANFVQLLWNAGLSSNFANFDLSTEAVTAGTYTNATITAQGNDWFRCSITSTLAVANQRAYISVIPATNSARAAAYTGNGTSGVYLWGAQLELGSTATNYQRVTTAYDITEAGVPTCHYVQYDGSDDSMSTAAIDFTGTDKMSVFAGVRKLSDAAQGVVVELSATIASNNGSFLLAAPDGATATFGFDSKGTTQVDAVASSLTAPISRIVTGLADIAGDRATIRIDGTQVAQSTADQGTGNYGNYPLFIGRRNNTNLPFNGRDFGIIVVGKAASAGEITDTETWLAARTAQVTL